MASSKNSKDSKKNNLRKSDMIPERHLEKAEEVYEKYIKQLEDQVERKREANDQAFNNSSHKILRLVTSKIQYF